MAGPTRVRLLPLDQIEHSAKNPRKHFDEHALDELAASIREVGVIQPITVTPSGDRFVIVAGERRWRAAKTAGLKNIPAVIRTLTPQEIAKISFIENLQRRDLDPIEEAEAIQDLVATLSIKAADVAEVLGKSASYVSSRLKLLELPDALAREVSAGRLSPVAGAALARMMDKDEALSIGMRAVREGLTVSAIEALVRERNQTHVSASRSVQREDAYNKKLRRLRAEQPGVSVVAFNEFDATLHQRTWNLRFPECRGCPKKGKYLGRDLREEELCVDALCYRRLEGRERTQRFALQARGQGELRNELEKILASETVEAPHLQVVAFTLLELMGPLSDTWRTKFGLPAAAESGADGEAWNKFSTASMDELMTWIIEFAVLYIAAGAGHAVRIPNQMIDEISGAFRLDRKLLAQALALSGEAGVTDEARRAAAVDVP